MGRYRGAFKWPLLATNSNAANAASQKSDSSGMEFQGLVKTTESISRRLVYLRIVVCLHFQEDFGPLNYRGPLNVNFYYRRVCGEKSSLKCKIL